MSQVTSIYHVYCFLEYDMAPSKRLPLRLVIISQLFDELDSNTASMSLDAPNMAMLLQSWFMD